MSKIFVSYNRSNELVVKSLAADIESLGHSAWFDQDLSGGQSWWDRILATIRDCSVFVFVLSPEGLNSTACKREYAYAAALGKPVLPVLVSDGVSINLLPPTLSKIEFVDYRKQDRDAAFRLARALISIPAPGPLPDPLPEPPKAPVSYLGELTEQVDSADTLSYQEQTALVADLRRSLRDSENIKDAHILLQRFRRRSDLLASVRDDIDDLLGNSKRQDVPEKRIMPNSEIDMYDEERVMVRSSPDDLTQFPPSPAISAGESTLPVQPVQRKWPRSWVNAVGSTSTRKVWAVIEGTVVGFVSCVFAFGTLFSLYRTFLSSAGWALGGAIVGIICENRLQRLSAIGIAVMLTLFVERSFLHDDFGYFLTAILPPLCALGVKFIARKAH